MVAAKSHKCLHDLGRRHPNLVSFGCRHFEWNCSKIAMPSQEPVGRATNEISLRPIVCYSTPGHCNTHFGNLCFKVFSRDLSELCHSQVFALQFFPYRSTDAKKEGGKPWRKTFLHINTLTQLLTQGRPVIILCKFYWCFQWLLGAGLETIGRSYSEDYLD